MKKRPNRILRSGLGALVGLTPFLSSCVGSEESFLNQTENWLREKLGDYDFLPGDAEFSGHSGQYARTVYVKKGFVEREDNNRNNMLGAPDDLKTYFGGEGAFAVVFNDTFDKIIVDSEPTEWVSASVFEATPVNLAGLIPAGALNEIDFQIGEKLLSGGITPGLSSSDGKEIFDLGRTVKTKMVYIVYSDVEINGSRTGATWAIDWIKSERTRD